MTAVAERGPHSGREFVVQPDEAERFWQRVRKADGCWQWEGAINCQTGYGTVNLRCLGRGPMTAHRVAFALSQGTVPRGLCVMHTCDNPPCVNPAHLVLGTHSDNMRDKADKGRAFRPAPQTHCANGHLRMGRNVSENGRCRPCNRENHARHGREMTAAWYAAQRERLKPYLPEDEAALEAKMTFRHAAILKSWFGLYGAVPMNGAQIGEVLGISRERVRQLLNRAYELLDVPFPRDEMPSMDGTDEEAAA